MTKIQLLSDTHSSKFEIDPSVSFAIHAGDITNYGYKNHPIIDWDNSILSFHKATKPIYWVPGNHDIGFKHNTTLTSKSVNCLEKRVFFNTISIVGVSLSVCYNLPELVDYWDHMTNVEREEQKYYNLFLNEYADIVVSHSPPTGLIGSEIGCGDIGSKYLYEYIEEYQPKLVVCGHVHDPLTRETKIGKTTVINVARQSRIIDFDKL